MEVGDTVVNSLGHYEWMEQANIWERRHGKHAGRLDVVGEVLSVRAQGIVAVGWWTAGVMVERIMFAENLEVLETPAA